MLYYIMYHNKIVLNHNKEGRTYSHSRSGAYQRNLLSLIISPTLSWLFSFSSSRSSSHPFQPEVIFTIKAQKVITFSHLLSRRSQQAARRSRLQWASLTRNSQISTPTWRRSRSVPPVVVFCTERFKKGKGIRADRKDLILSSSDLVLC